MDRPIVMMYDGDLSATRHPAGRPGANDDNEVLLGSAAVLAAKLRPPPARDGHHLARTALVDRMLAREAEPIVAVVAPPRLRQDDAAGRVGLEQPREVAWVSVDEGDNDPSVLLAATAMALSRAHPIDAGVIDAVAHGPPRSRPLCRALTSACRPADAMTLVLDNVESLDQHRSRSTSIAELAWRLPAGSRLAYGSRSPLPLPDPLLRSRRSLVEIGRDDLAMDRGEAEQLLAATGAELSARRDGRLLEQTEGWPAGLYLAGLASKGRRPRRPTFAVPRRRRADGRLPPHRDPGAPPGIDTVAFLTRTSVLDQMSGPPCDAVLGADGSQAMLESLESSNLLLVPLDRQRTWYRYHRLFRDLLATELERREPSPSRPARPRRPTGWRPTACPSRRSARRSWATTPSSSSASSPRRPRRLRRRARRGRPVLARVVPQPRT